jgi:hypothetical protein
MDEDFDLELDQLQQSKWKQLKSATHLALEHRRRVKEGDLSVFLMPLAFALAKDGIFDFIPFIGLVFGFFISVYLFIFMWGRGKWKVRLVVFFLSLLDLIPFINLIPFQTVCVLYAYHVAKKDADKSKGVLDSLDRATPKMADDLRGVARQRALVQSRAAQEAASSNASADASTEAETLSAQGDVAQNPRMTRLSRGADWVPVVGSAKMVGESVAGKRLDGRRLSGTDRVRHGATGAAFMAADMTGVGEVTRLGKAGMIAARLGEQEVARAAGRQMSKEGGKLYERGRQRAAANDAVMRRAA